MLYSSWTVTRNTTCTVTIFIEVLASYQKHILEPPLEPFYINHTQIFPRWIFILIIILRLGCFFWNFSDNRNASLSFFLRTMLFFCAQILLRNLSNMILAWSFEVLLCPRSASAAFNSQITDKFYRALSFLHNKLQSCQFLLAQHKLV